MSSTEKNSIICNNVVWDFKNLYYADYVVNWKKTLLFATNVAWPQNTIMRDHKKLNAMHSSIKWWFPTHK
jgi:hypothetical protein